MIALVFHGIHAWRGRRKGFPASEAWSSEKEERNSPPRRRDVVTVSETPRRCPSVPSRINNGGSEVRRGSGGTPCATLNRFSQLRCWKPLLASRVQWRPVLPQLHQQSPAARLIPRRYWIALRLCRSTGYSQGEVDTLWEIKLVKKK